MLNRNKGYEITYAELKTFKGFETVSEDEAKEICSQLRELSLILYDIFQFELDKEAKRNILLRSLKPRKHETNDRPETL